MTDSTAVFGLTMPSADGSDNFSADLWRDLAQDVEDKSPGITPMTTTTRTGLTGGDKYNGRVVYDTTLNKLFVSDGTNWHEVTQAALPLAGGTMTGNIAMGGTNKVTGLAAATTNGDAVRYEQISTLGNWQAWTPSWVSGTSATVTSARYSQIGKTVHWSMNVSAASGGDLDFTLPVTAASTVRSVGHYSVPLNTHFGTTSYLDFGPVLMVVADATRAVFQRISQDASAAAATLSGSTVGSIGFHASGTYEAA